MSPQYRIAFVGGLIASTTVAATLSLLVLIGLIPKAGFVAAWQAVAGGGWVTATIIGGALFILIGALWAVPFPALFAPPTVPKGILWGGAPTLFAWTFVAGVVMDAPLFGGFTAEGLILPIIMNCLIWGSIVGEYCHRHARTAPPAAGYGYE